MALIKCKDCGADVSDSAQACPKCAFPMKGTMHDGVSTTIQSTGKKLKLHKLYAFLTFIIGAVILLSSVSGENIGGMFIGGILLSISAVWTLINGIKKWWHHE